MRLELRNVVKHYRTESEAVRAVDGVSLQIGDGEMVGIYGPSGSGKSTLLTLAAALMPPDSGQVLAGGVDVTALSARAAAEYRLAEVGFVFQTFHLIGAATVLDNAIVKLLLAGMSPADARERVEPWLDRLGLGGRMDHTPGRLSVGERQRVAIARAISNEPSLLLADEPTGSLDTERGADVLGLMRELARERGIGVLLATHDPQAVNFVDRVCVLRDGRLSEVDELAVPELPGG